MESLSFTIHRLYKLLAFLKLVINQNQLNLSSQNVLITIIALRDLILKINKKVLKRCFLNA